MVVNTRNWWPGKKVVVSPEWIASVSWPDSRVNVDLIEEQIKAAPDYDSPKRRRRWRKTGTSLLEEVKRRIREISEEQHELARRQRILTHAATQLRLGRAVPIVLAEIRDQSPDVLLEPVDPEPTWAPAPLRSVRRVTGHSA